MLSSDQTLKWMSDSTQAQPHPKVEAIELRTEAIASYITANGRIDVLQEIPAAGGYDQLIKNARRYQVGDTGITLYLASLADVISSKLEAGRSKDFYALPGLREAEARLAAEPDEERLDVERFSLPDNPSAPPSLDSH